MKPSILLSLLLILITRISYCGTIDPNTNDSKYVELGKDFECVIRLCGEYKDNTLFCASAVVINENWILTAAHVVENASKAKLVDDDNSEYLVKDIVVHPDFERSAFNGNDIAILYCENEINLSKYPDLYEDDDEIGRICYLSGYGLTGTFETGSIRSDNKKRAGSNTIDKIENELLICSPSKGIIDGKTSLEFLIASGDSGGGLFIDNKIAGINSCVFAVDKKTNSGYTDESGHTRISKHLGWIRTIINRK